MGIFSEMEGLQARFRDGGGGIRNTAAKGVLGRAAENRMPVAIDGGGVTPPQQNANGGDSFVPAGATKDSETGLIKFGGYDPYSESQAAAGRSIAGAIGSGPKLVGMADPNPQTIPDPETSVGPNVTLQDLYGEPAPTAEGPTAAQVAPATGAEVRETQKRAARVGTPGVSQAAQSTLTEEQQVDMELARILEQGGPLMSRAEAEGIRQANQRGLQNTSMAAGMVQGAMVDRALPMAQQNAAQGFQRTLANTQNRQQSGIFNAEQRNEAERLSAQMRSALEQQDSAAYNQANQQLAALQRNAEAQQADIEFSAEQQRATEQQAYNTQIIDRTSQLNQQFLQNMGAADIANIQGTYNQLIQMNATAGNVMTGYMTSMGQIMDDPDMTPSQVSTALRSQQTMLEASLRMIGEINNMDIGDVEETIPGGAAGGGTTTPPAGGPGSGGRGGGGRRGGRGRGEQF